MARIVGGVGTTHVPAIGGAIARHLENEPYWKPFFDGFHEIHRWLDAARPDVVVVFYNDHGLNFFLDKMPTFAVGAADEYRNSDEGWGIPVAQPYPGDSALSWHIIDWLVKSDFDITMCQQMLVDHAFTIPLSLLWPGKDARPVRTVPICVNTVQHPLPSPSRCFHLGQAVGRAIENYPSDDKVLIVGTGGLSHQLDGERAGFINRTFDLMCLDKIVGAPQELAALSSLEIVEKAGSQGVELLNWIAMRGALPGHVTKRHQNYHIPISNTASAALLLENDAAVPLRKAG